MVGNCFAERNAPRILECLRCGERPGHAFTQRIAVIIMDDFRAAIGCNFRVLPLAGCAPLTFSGRNFSAINGRFRIPRPSFRDQLVQRDCIAGAANRRRQHDREANYSQGFPKLSRPLQHARKLRNRRWAVNRQSIISRFVRLRHRKWS